MKINGRLIPNKDLCNLPLDTKVLVHCFDEDYWVVCEVKQNDLGLYLHDIATNSNLTEIDPAELDEFCRVYEYNHNDAMKLLEGKADSTVEVKAETRYIFDKDNMAILDTAKNCIVCLIETKRPDVLETKLSELLTLANRPSQIESTS